jgi:hypothetical protein
VTVGEYADIIAVQGDALRYRYRDQARSSAQKGVDPIRNRVSGWRVMHPVGWQKPSIVVVLNWRAALKK